MHLRTNRKSVLSANNQWILKFPHLISKGFVLKPRCDPELGFSSVCRLPWFSFEVEQSLPTSFTHTSFSECWFFKRPGRFPYILHSGLMTASLWSQLNHIPAPYISWKLEVRSKVLIIQCLVPHTVSSLEVWKVKRPHSGKVCLDQLVKVLTTPEGAFPFVISKWSVSLHSIILVNSLHPRSLFKSWFQFVNRFKYLMKNW